MAGGEITSDQLEKKIVVYKSKRATNKEDNALFGKQTTTNLKSLAQSPTAEKYWMKTRNAGHGWTLSAPLFSCNDCGYITYKS